MIIIISKNEESKSSSHLDLHNIKLKKLVLVELSITSQPARSFIYFLCYLIKVPESQQWLNRFTNSFDGRSIYECSHLWYFNYYAVCQEFNFKKADHLLLTLINSLASAPRIYLVCFDQDFTCFFFIKNGIEK